MYSQSGRGILFLSPGNHSETSQLWWSVSLRMRRTADRNFSIRVLHCMQQFEKIWLEKFMCLRGNTLPCSLGGETAGGRELAYGVKIGDKF